MLGREYAACVCAVWLVLCMGCASTPPNPSTQPPTDWSPPQSIDHPTESAQPATQLLGELEGEEPAAQQEPLEDHLNADKSSDEDEGAAHAPEDIGIAGALGGDLVGKGRLEHIFGEESGAGTLGLRGHVELLSLMSQGCEVDALRRVLGRGKGGIGYCYEMHLRKSPGLAGRVAFKARLDASGAVSKAEVTHTTLKHPKAQACMKRVIQRWRFDAPRCSMTFSFDFSTTPP